MSASVVAIIGGGFCGVVSAVRLLDAGAGVIRKVILIEKQARVGRGLAYGTEQDVHLLNAPAAEMSAFAEDPQHFVRFLRTVDSHYSATDFVPRWLYGEYLQSLLALAIRHTPVEFVRVQAQAIDIHTMQPAGQNMGGRVVIALDDGSRISADRAILACGNPGLRQPLRHLDEAQELQQSQRYIHDPWQAEALQRIDMSRPVVILGAGLTAVDIACSLQQRGFTQTIHMVSRHGLQPLAHGEPPSTVALPLLHAFTTSRGALRALRTHMRLAEQRGDDVRALLAALRKHIPSLWQRWPLAERRRFLRHVQRYWDMQRHRLAPGAARRLQALAAQGMLQRHAGRIVGVTMQPDHLHITLQPRQGLATLSITAGTVINCTGLCSDIEHSDDALLTNLRRRGLCSADPLRLGLHCADNYALIGAATHHDAQAAQTLFYVGPYLRAQFWEATAVPELREHITALVSGLVQPPMSMPVPRPMKLRAHA